jgi:membrane protease YdiL (CAAX protease family)
MSGLFNSIYNAVVSNLLVDALYNKTSSLVSNVIANPTAIVTPVATVGLLRINLAAMALGEATSLVTRGYVQLNNFVPQSMRNFLRWIGDKIARVNDEADNRISEFLRVGKEWKKWIGFVITGPIIEELLFRLPLLLASWKIRDMTSEFFCSPIFSKRIISVTGAQATMAALAIPCSVAFTYVHDDEPTPERAAGVLGVGLTLSYITMSEDGGLTNAIAAHMIHNFASLRCGMQKIEKGILPKNPEKEYQSAI